jgi:hypothetical protein
MGDLNRFNIFTHPKEYKYMHQICIRYASDMHQICINMVIWEDFGIGNAYGLPHGGQADNFLESTFVTSWRRSPALFWDVLGRFGIEERERLGMQMQLL